MKHRIAAFTLVELLVVIGIIALLISILLPSLNKARQSAVSAQCLSNLKQIGNAAMLYANDNKGWLPPDDASAPDKFANSGTGNEDYSSRFRAMLLMAKYLGVNNPVIVANNTVPVPCLYCPADSQPVYQSGTNIIQGGPTYFLDITDGGTTNNRFNYYWWGNPMGTNTSISGPLYAQVSNPWDKYASTYFVDTTLATPATGGNCAAGMEYVRRVGDKNAASIGLCSCRTFQKGNAFYVHGSSNNGWINELYGDFHAVSLLGGPKRTDPAYNTEFCGQLRWRWGGNSGESSKVFY